MNGNECLCSEEPPDTSMEYARDEIEDETCNVTCSGNSEYVCGGANALNLYVASMKDNKFDLLHPIQCLRYY